ncbi:MAG: amidohydrolase [Proteobacteria bacterium]|nr:amidohydrolase [Pseudomonadota bacterium]
MLKSEFSVLFNLTEAEKQYIRNCKSHLHKYPEVSWHEFETTSFLRHELEAIEGVEILPYALNTGLIAKINGIPGKRCVALRADIDALALDEAWDSPDKSLNPGRAHGCGHDFHMSALLGAAKMLARTRDKWPGSVLLIFQPAEETTNGALEILRTGCFEDHHVQAIFGLHNRPEVETGKVVVKAGPLMAAKINFKITVHGLGGHGSMPHKCIDPIVCAAAIVQNVLTITSRNVDPMRALVLSICSIHGGTPDNLIVDTVEMTGSMRYLDPDTGTRALERLKTIVSATAQTFECTSDFEIVESVPSVINHESLLPLAQTAASMAIGPDADIVTESCLATEDFAQYMQRVPGFFYWVGARKHGDTCHAWHNAQFHTDDDALSNAAQILAWSAYLYLVSDI